MRLEIKKADSADNELLAEMDSRIFSASDAFPGDVWEDLISYWVILDGERIGSISMKHDSGYWSGEYPARPGCVYIASTGLLPEWRGKGLGEKLKAWEVDYARRLGFKVAVTNCRESNKKIIGLNKKFGFRAVKTHPNYYECPTEDSVVMELKL